MEKRRKSSFPPGTFEIAEGPYRPVFADSGKNRYPKAAEAFYKVAMLLFPKLDGRQYSFHAGMKLMGKVMPHIGDHYPIGSFHTYHTGTDEQRAAMDELFNTVEQAIEDAHQAGIERGKALLVQLAQGGLTLKEFNDSVIKGEER